MTRTPLSKLVLLSCKRIRASLPFLKLELHLYYYPRKFFLFVQRPCSRLSPWTIQTMSSALQSVSTSLQQDNYGSRLFILTQGGQYGNFVAVALITAVGYDYGELSILFQFSVPTFVLPALTFSNEA